MSAKDDGLTGEVLDKAEPPPPELGVYCCDCGRELISETAWVGGFGEISCMECHGVSEEIEEHNF